jgi:hypothetical protein
MGWQNFVPEQTHKSDYMQTLLLFKDIYRNAFASLEHFITKNFFKVFAWFSFAMFTVVVYAFLFRVLTGFAFV